MVLKVSVGPTYDNLQIIKVNDDFHPFLIDSPEFVGRVAIRIKDFVGITPDGGEPIKNSGYFSHHNRRFSMHVEGRFKKHVTAEDVWFGTDFDRKIPIPDVFWLGLKAAEYIDPAMETNNDLEKPWILSPYICAINAFASWPAPSEDPNPNPIEDPTFEKTLGPWKWGGENRLEEHNSIITGEEMSVSKRRKYFFDINVRRNFVFDTKQVYAFDFFAPHMDFNTFDAKLGISFNVEKYMEGHPIRYTCRSKDGQTIYFVLQFEQIHDEKEHKTKSTKRYSFFG
ncbi:hypothetical protein K493DRAFT_310386 [Basidiobolus meristosporus CBS 931.73]|uniref:Domain of unknown function at the cortex 1 domain-containing protein n=1 Tax=Basidiobolus meristosporus CBS 931.73 TaxID=1314790 RepID=A0A1Y1Z9Z6_9FUNG|nr:hypothetical protein K493DRAFT_310386 [Basidiobolus meristosporus CBS 931.73]|eukprot:ORY06986.1 hypothetical protein K493DRAFT_310386 [Basidiobolus meristosporus CBS 931.73]